MLLMDNVINKLIKLYVVYAVKKLKPNTKIVIDSYFYALILRNKHVVKRK